MGEENPLIKLFSLTLHYTHTNTHKEKKSNGKISKKYLSSKKQEKSSFQVGRRVKADQISVLKKKQQKSSKIIQESNRKKRPFTSKAQARLMCDHECECVNEL
ncbi:hypothetical protein ACFFRR_003495 [Megaselia abdita]